MTSDLWNRLVKVRALKFTSRSKSPGKRADTSGQGDVEVSHVDDLTLLFSERVRWENEAGKELVLRNVYRWTRMRDDSFIRLEHLRHGPDKPVHLADLYTDGDNVFQSKEPHHCGADTYTAAVEAGETELVLSWRVKGPEKDEAYCSRYRDQGCPKLVTRGT